MVKSTQKSKQQQHQHQNVNPPKREPMMFLMLYNIQAQSKIYIHYIHLFYFIFQKNVLIDVILYLKNIYMCLCGLVLVL